ncbi:hypothetical protein [Terriglobus roseus]|nr:hypothetical protein [Terriglobus roseus]
MSPSKVHCGGPLGLSSRLPLGGILADCYPRLQMHLLLQIAAGCSVPTLVGVTLWRIAQRRTAVGSKAEARIVRRRSSPHPRLDLAAGVVASAQAVRHPARRQGIQVPKASVTSAQTGLEGPPRRRPDWAYFNQDNGDLSDPAPGGLPAGGVQRPFGSLSKPER